MRDTDVTVSASTLEHIREITLARSMEDVWARHIDKMAEFGFDRMIYGFTRFRSTVTMADMHDAVILTNHSEDYRRAYIDEGLYTQAAMVRWAAENPGALSWAYAAERMQRGLLSDEERRVLEFNRAHGLTAGYTISFKGVSAISIGAIGLCARSGMSQEAVDALWAISGGEIVAMNNVMHLKLLQLPYRKGDRLSPRQREVLQWVADGKTVQDVACVMGLTAATVEKHLRRARQALDAETTAHAIMKAAIQNQIFLIE
ncbi:LuxR family transcriptional regulator [Rhodovulum sp. YNF3179]|uniref:LuxR family transcriptional regulator n=1 Tax=Rhodovulum sp. YNF3179 TaxID=3425127 RepID=UPI003D325547